MPDAEWGRRVVAVVVSPSGDPRPRRPPWTTCATGSPRSTRVSGRPASWSGSREIPLLPNGKVDRLALEQVAAEGPAARDRTRGGDARLLDPDAHPLPRDHHPRGHAPARPGRLGRVQPVPGVRRPGGRALAALRRSRPRTRAGRSRCATRCPSTSPSPPSAPSRPPRSSARRRLPHGEGQGRRAGADPAPRRRPGSRRSATPSGPPAGSGSTPTAAGRSTRRSPRSRARPRRRRPGVRRAALRLRGGPGPGAPPGGRAGRGRRVDPPRRGPLPGARPGGRRRRGAQGAAARRGPRVPADRRGHRPAGRGLLARWRPRSGSPPGSRSRRRCPSCPTPAGLATVQLLTDDVVADPLLPRRRGLPVVRPEVDLAALDRRRASRTGPTPGARGWPTSRRSGRISPRDHAPGRSRQPVDRPGHRARRRARARRGPRRRARARLPVRRAGVRAARGPTPAGSGCTCGSTSARPASSRSAWPGPAAQRRCRW